MAPYSAKPEKNRTADAEATGRRASRRTSTSGRARRSAWTVNAATSAPPASSGMSASAWPKPAARPAFVRPRMMAATPGASRTRPVTSRRGLAEAGGAERHVDPEHEAPAQVHQDGAADERAEDRAQQGGERDDGDGPAERLAARRLHDQRGEDREHEAAACALDDAPGDERADVPGQAGADGASQEDREREHPQPL